MANHKTGSERYNDRMNKIHEDARMLERDRLERGEKPNPSLTSPEEALKYGWVIRGREVSRAASMYGCPDCGALRGSNPNCLCCFAVKACW